MERRRQIPWHYYPTHEKDVYTVYFIVLLLTSLMMFLLALTTQYTLVVLGLPWWATIFFVLASFFGSFVNIPLFTIKSQTSETQEYLVRFFFMSYVIRVPTMPKKTLISVNVGGCVIPTIISLWIILQNLKDLPLFILAVLLITLLIYPLATPVKGLGITMPFLVPPIVSAIIALIIGAFSGNLNLAPSLAYVGGVLGTLIGADILNLPKIPDLDAPMASIGGAGTWDGIFLTGIFSVSLILLIIPPF